MIVRFMMIHQLLQPDMDPGVANTLCSAHFDVGSSTTVADQGEHHVWAFGVDGDVQQKQLVFVGVSHVEVIFDALYHCRVVKKVVAS